MELIYIITEMKIMSNKKKEQHHYFIHNDLNIIACINEHDNKDVFGIHNILKKENIKEILIVFF